MMSETYFQKLKKIKSVCVCERAHACMSRESMHERVHKCGKMLTFGESNEKYMDIHCTAV